MGWVTVKKITRRGYPVDLPSKLYKFMTRAHAEGFLTAGKFRVGTLFEYRKMETYGDITLDVREGMMEQTEKVSAAFIHQLTERSQAMLKGLDPNTPVTNSSFTGMTTANNCHIYCTSLEPSWAGADPGYDACIEISDVTLFVIALLNAFERKGLKYKSFNVNPIQYSGRDLRLSNNYGAISDDDNDLRAEFRKEARHAPQQEYRIIVLPENGTLVEPFLAEEPSMNRFCRIHSFRPEKEVE